MAERPAVAVGHRAGIDTFIDRQLAGAFGKDIGLDLQGPFRKGKPQHGYQLPPLRPNTTGPAWPPHLWPAASASAGISTDSTVESASNSWATSGGGKIPDAPLNLAEWFNGLVYPLFERGAFADPIYGGNRDKAAWRMIGYPGLPAIYGQDVVRYRGKPHPRATKPQSIQDLS